MIEDKETRVLSRWWNVSPLFHRPFTTNYTAIFAQIPIQLQKEASLILSKFFEIIQDFGVPNLG